MKTTTLLASVAALALTFGVAMAQTEKKAAAPAKAQTPESIECSKQADAKNLHGKERKTFRSKCKKDLLEAAKKKT
jgi:psiF repeat